MTLDRLRVFAAVARQRSVSRAADELHITQPAVTKQLKVLARDFNVRLFQRNGRGIELTDTGRIFLRDARSIISQFDKLKGKFRAEASVSSSETLTVGGSYSPSVDLLPSLLAVFRKNHPHVRINLRADNKAAIERMIVNSEIDLAVINNPLPNHLLVIEHYRQERLVAFGLPNSSLSKKRNLNWQDLAQTRIVVRNPIRGQNAAKQFLQTLTKQGVTPNVVMRCDSPEAVKAAVKKKIGIGILFEETVAHEVIKGAFSLINLPFDNLAGESFIVYRKNRPLSKAAQDFLNILRDHREVSAEHQKTNPANR